MNRKANAKRLFHVSEQAGITEFVPRPSPSYFKMIDADVVFAITENLLPNYLLPRDCPRVTYYAGPNTIKHDRETFMVSSGHVICVPHAWQHQIATTILYCYEFLPETFVLLDACAGYYISYQTVKPIAVWTTGDCIAALRQQNIELRFMDDITQIAESVKNSSLNYSLIRMCNA